MVSDLEKEVLRALKTDRKARVNLVDHICQDMMVKGVRWCCGKISSEAKQKT